MKATAEDFVATTRNHRLKEGDDEHPVNLINSIPKNLLCVIFIFKVFILKTP